MAEPSDGSVRVRRAISTVRIALVLAANPGILKTHVIRAMFAWVGFGTFGYTFTVHVH